tara:strand:+ start:2886 stop:3428 length:543 start_codon:yes stop_codon:yes gene_type:complete
MSDITLGRGKVQYKEIAGYTALYFILTNKLGANVTYSGTTGMVTDLIALSAYKYDLVTGTNIDDDSQASGDTGTKFNTIAGTITLIGHLSTDPFQFDKLQAGQYSIVGELRNGKAKLFSPDNPIDITSLKVLHGAGEGDLIGATMDLAGKADKLSPYITGAVKGSPFGGLVTPSNVTVVS